MYIQDITEDIRNCYCLLRNYQGSCKSAIGYTGKV